MRINKIQLINFGLFADATFEFGDPHWIEDSNAKGKTTILEAIEWGIFGTNKAKKYSKVKLGEKSSTVIVWLSHNNKDYIIHRESEKKVSISGQPKTGDEIHEIFGTPEQFAMSIYPEYFMGMSSPDRRAALNCFFENKELMEGLYKEYIGKDPDFNILDSKDRIKKIKSIIKEYSESLKEKEIQVDTLKGECANDAFETADKNIVSYENEIKEAQKNLDESTMQRPTNQSAAKIAELNLKISRKKEELAKLKEPSKELMQNRIDQLKAKKQSCKLKTIEEANCPTCGHSLGEDKVSEINAAELKKYSDELLKISAAEDTLKLDLVKFKKEKEGYGLNFSRIQDEITDLEKEKNSIDSSQYETEYSQWFDKNRTLTIELNQLRAKQSLFTQEQTRVLTIQNRKLEREDRIKKIEEEIEIMKSSIDIELLNKQLFILGPEGIDRSISNIIVSEIRKYIPEEYDLVLQEEMKSKDGIKNIFDIQKNGIQYNMLSVSEKIILGTNLCQFIQTFYPYDLFIVDNAESIDHRISVDGQVIGAIVTQI